VISTSNEVSPRENRARGAYRVTLFTARTTGVRDENRGQPMTTAKLAKTKALRAYTYERVSRDETGAARSVTQQSKLNVGTIKHHPEWTHAGSFVDNDKGASRFSVGERPDFSKLCRAIEAGEVDVVVVWELSRLTRDLEVWAAFAKLCRDHGVIVCAGGRVYDLDNYEDEFVASLTGILSVREAGQIRARVNRARDAGIESGAVWGRPVFGYQRIYDDRTGRLLGQEPHPVEGPVVVDMYRRLALGETFVAVAKHLNVNGIARPSGGTWSQVAVRDMVRDKPVYLGHRVHKGEIVKRDCWPALVDVDVYETVQALFLARRNPGHNTRAAHLLTGILVCDKCGGGVRAMAGRGAYTCKGNPTDGVDAHRSCLSRRKHLVDLAVETAILARFAQPGALAALIGAKADEIELSTVKLAALRAEMQEADEDLDAGQISARTHSRVEARCLPQIAELEAASAAARVHVPAKVIELAEAKDKPARWASYDLADKRAVIAAVMTDLRLLPAVTAEKWTRNGVGISWSWTGDDEVHVVV
jgi:site-specific DNA recombinase